MVHTINHNRIHPYICHFKILSCCPHNNLYEINLNDILVDYYSNLELPMLVKKYNGLKLHSLLAFFLKINLIIFFLIFFLYLSNIIFLRNSDSVKDHNCYCLIICLSCFVDQVKNLLMHFILNIYNFNHLTDCNFNHLMSYILHYCSGFNDLIMIY